MIAIFFALLFIVPFITSPAIGQQSQVLDKIVATIGREIVLQSDIEGRIAMFMQQNPKVNPNDPALRKQVLEALISERLMVTKAVEDSITVQEEEINQSLDFMMQNMLQTYGSEKRVEDLYGMSISRIRKNYREEVRKQLLVERLQQQRFMNVKCSNREVEDFFQQYRDSIRPIPASAELAHIVKQVKPSADAKDEVKRLALHIRDSLVKGADFAEMAKRHSGDPGSAASGGDLGWVDKGKLVSEYERAAYELQSGEYSQPIETPFGFHIIQTIEKRKDAIHTKHILLKLGGSNDDKKRVEQILSDLKDRCSKGESFEELAKQYSDEKETQGFGGSMGTIELTRLPAELKSVIESLPENGVSQPLPYMSDPTKPAMHIILKKKVIAEHTPTLANDYKKLEQMAVQYKQAKLMETFLKELRTMIPVQVTE
ncbi:MAG: peptidylprolyl isomerase [Bacteroidota bacterium]|nr:parvulin peptidyl-prolyl isomerase [bacterium]NBP63301.1 parvulin peptidyl-prolyl isomerase [Bacteroidota bacterium]